MSGCNKKGYPDVTIMGMDGSSMVIYFCEEHWKKWNS